MKYLIVIEKTKTGFCAYSPDVDGCVAAGSTRRETEKLMREALGFHFEAMAEDGERAPKATSTSAYVEVKQPKVTSVPARRELNMPMSIRTTGAMRDGQRRHADSGAARRRP